MTGKDGCTCTWSQYAATLTQQIAQLAYKNQKHHKEEMQVGTNTTTATLNTFFNCYKKTSYTYNFIDQSFTKKEEIGSRTCVSYTFAVSTTSGLHHSQVECFVPGWVLSAKESVFSGYSVPLPGKQRGVTAGCYLTTSNTQVQKTTGSKRHETEIKLHKKNKFTQNAVSYLVHKLFHQTVHLS